MQKLNEKLDSRSSRKTRKSYEAKFPGLKRLSPRSWIANTSLAEKLRTLFREQGITITAILTAIGMIISTIVVLLTGGGGSRAAPPKNKLVEWFKDKLKRLSDALKRLAGKAVAALPGIIGSVFGAVLNFLAKAAGFAATHVWTFLVFVVGLVAWVYTQS